MDLVSNSIGLWWVAFWWTAATIAAIVNTRQRIFRELWPLVLFAVGLGIISVSYWIDIFGIVEGVSVEMRRGGGLLIGPGAFFVALNWRRYRRQVDTESVKARRTLRNGGHD